MESGASQFLVVKSMLMSGFLRSSDIISACLEVISSAVAVAHFKAEKEKTFQKFCHIG